MLDIIYQSLPYVVALLAWALRVEVKLAKMHSDIAWIIKLLDNPGTDKDK